MTNNFESRLNFNNDNYEKDIVKKAVIDESKQELSEFDYLKLCGYEYDKFKHQLDELNISPKQKELILKLTNKLAYNVDNDANKLEILKDLNDIIKKIKNGKESTQQLIKEIKDKYAEHPILKSIGVAILMGIIAVITASSATELAIFGGIAITTIMISYGISEKIHNSEIEKNKLFDIINDIYPDITKKEFEQLVKAFDEGNFDIDKFNTILEKYYKDGKITPEEHKAIMAYLKSIS